MEERGPAGVGGPRRRRGGRSAGGGGLLGRWPSPGEEGGEVK